MEFDYDKFYGYLMQFFFPLMAILTGLFIWATYPAMTRKIFSTPLLGREKEIRQLINKIMTGQSGAVIGIFGQERTEVLTCLRDKNLYGREADNLIFSYVDISTLEPDCTQEQFWRKVLAPLPEKISHDGDLDKLFEQVNQARLRFILLLDRFHDIVHKPNLNQAIFLARLRSLSTSVHPSPLCLMISAQESLRKLHEEITQEMGYSTSPYFNFMDVGEITLGALSEPDRDSVLKKLKLSKEAQHFIKHEVGRHPYLLKIATNRLTEAYEAQETNPVEVTKQHFNQHCKALLDDMLPTWSSKKCQVFVQIAQGTFSNPDDYTEELEELEKQGLIQPENGQWQVFSPVFVELLKEQDISKLCSKESK
jgi:hypothetical protein